MRDTRESSRASDAGFTMIELVVTLGIFLLVVGAALAVFDSGLRNQTGQASRTQALDDAEVAMSRVTKDLRQALSLTTSSTSSEIDMQTLLNGVQHRVVYSVVSGRLGRAVDGGGAAPVGGTLTTGSVFCYDPPTCSAPNPASANPTIVRVTLIMQPSDGTAAAIPLVSDVHLRNAA